RYGLPYLGARNEPLALYFPAYPNTANAGFTAELPAQTLARGTADVRTVVINSVGTRTEIDRRRLVTESRCMRNLKWRAAILLLAPFAACVLVYLPTLSGALLSDDYAVLAALSEWSQEGL